MAAALTVALAAALALLAGAARAGTLQAIAAAAFSGATGLRVTLVDSCIFPVDQTVDSPPTIFGTFGACDTLTVEGVEMLGGAFRAGQAIVLGEGFSVAAGAQLTAAIEPQSVPFAYLTDDSPDDEITYRAEFRLDADSLSLADGDLLANLVGLSGAGESWFELRLKRNPMLAENRIVLRARLDGGGFADTPSGGEVLLPAGYNLVELKWAAGAGTGSLLVSVNGGNFVGLTHLDNDQGRVDRVLWGAVSGAVDSSSGSLDLDDFDSSG